jgi:hypothetical protein
MSGKQAVFNQACQGDEKVLKPAASKIEINCPAVN